MLCCMRRTKQVEKNEDADQKIDQDTNKPEDKAHKAATKIQASFRGHITRKKLKGEKQQNGAAVGAASPVEAEGKKEGKSAAAEQKEKETPATESAASNDVKHEEADKAASSSERGPSEIKQGDEVPVSETKAEASEKAKVDVPEGKSASSEKAATPGTESATTVSTENAPSPKATEALDKGEVKQADVPAADTSETTPKPTKEASESSQSSEKTDSVEETKPTESAQEEVQEEEKAADEEAV
ncbi:neuromodulin [Protopterus annectens]|uniref:neuromodulin n=1 Tax=Protopterus annectens TaxID=7888 RepID=UPI001CF9C07E|nr:neuromodulin [Protopterus annectens]